MYMAFIKKVFSYSTLKTKMAAIISEAAEQAVELPEKVKKKREKDLKFAIQRQIALQVQEHSLMLGQEFVIKARPLSTEDNQEPNIYCLAKKGAFEKIMGKKQKKEEDEDEVLREERVKNKTWKVAVPAGEILTPGDFVVSTTCLALVLNHNVAEEILTQFQKLVAESADEH
ncbi:uncharacterized protein LOC142358218 [Convolutriloba macropyga]